MSSQNDPADEPDSRIADAAPNNEAPTIAGRPVAITSEAETIGRTSDSALLSKSVEGRTFGEYELLAEIARGGMGVVYKARQRRLNRTVAVKMILAGELADREEVRRFLSEAEAAAGLDHPGIVPVYESGEIGGQHFFSMGFVDGQSLAALLAAGPLPPRRAAELVAQVAEAVEYAHQRGVIHRDLKPGNILLDRESNPRVTDFGLAKRVTGDSGLTRTGQALGTPSYMPPEQASGKLDAIGRPADVYALGAVLYATLTGRPPFQAATPLETILQVLEQEPVAPRQLNADVPRDLETIVLRCLEKEPHKRYATARDLADELRRFLRGEPIHARPVGRLERAWRWCRRNPVVATLAASVIAVLVAGAGVSTYFAIEAGQRATAEETAKIKAQRAAEGERRQTIAAETQRAKAEEAAESEKQLRLVAERQLRIATAQRLAAQSYLKRSESPDVSLSLAVESGRATRADDEGLLGLSHRALLDAVAAIDGQILTAHRGAITSVAASPDGRWIVTGGPRQVRVWDAGADDPRATSQVLAACAPPGGLAISADSRRLVTSSLTFGAALVWDLTAATAFANPIVLSGHRTPVTSVAISEDGRWVVTGSDDNVARVFDLTTGDPSGSARVLGGPTRRISCLAISPDSRWVAVGSWDNTARIWDITAADPSAKPRVLGGHQWPINCLAISPDGRWLATGSQDAAQLWDLAAEDAAAHPLVPGGQPRFGAFCLAFSSDSRLLVTGPSVRVYDLTADDPGAKPRALGGLLSATCLAISPDSRWLVGGVGRAGQVWDLKAKNPAAEPRLLTGHQQQITSVAISPDSRWIVTGSRDETARVWQLIGRNPAANPQVLGGHQKNIAGIEITPDSRWLVTASQDKTVRMWDLAHPNPAANPRVLRGHDGYINCLAISPDGHRVATAGNDKTVRIWDLAADDPAAEPRVLTGHSSHILSLAISPDGRWVVTGSADKTARVWDLTADDPNANARVLDEEDAPLRLAISPDSRWLVTARHDNTARLWDLAADDPNASRQPVVDEDLIYHLAFSPDSRWLVTVGLSTCVRDLRAESPADNPRVLVGPRKQRIERLAISLDSRWAIAAMNDGILRLWHLGAEGPDPEPRILKGHQMPISAMTISPDGRWLLTACADQTARAWDLRADDPGASPVVLTGHTGMVESVTMTLDGRWIVTGSSGDRTVRVWDFRAENPSADPLVLPGYLGTTVRAGLYNPVRISPDGRWIFAGSQDRMVQLWRWQWDDLTPLAAQVGRNLTAQEWKLYFAETPYRKTFPDLPGPTDP